MHEHVGAQARDGSQASLTYRCGLVSHTAAPGETGRPTHDERAHVWRLQTTVPNYREDDRTLTKHERITTMADTTRPLPPRQTARRKRIGRSQRRWPSRRRATSSCKQGRYGPLFPKTPANYGFTIIAKVKPGREEAIRAYGKTIEEAVKADPTVLAALQAALPALGPVRNRFGSALHVPGHLRHRFRQVHRGRRLQLFNQIGITTVFENLEGFPEDWKTNLPAVRQVRA